MMAGINVGYGASSHQHRYRPIEVNSAENPYDYDIPEQWFDWCAYECNALQHASYGQKTTYVDESNTVQTFHSNKSPYPAIAGPCQAFAALKGSICYLYAQPVHKVVQGVGIGGKWYAWTETQLADAEGRFCYHANYLSGGGLIEPLSPPPPPLPPPRKMSQVSVCLSSTFSPGTEHRRPHTRAHANTQVIVD